MRSEYAVTAEPVGLSNRDIGRFIVVSKELRAGKKLDIRCRNEGERFNGQWIAFGCRPPQVSWKGALMPYALI
jgi:hypothetical protein